MTQPIEAGIIRILKPDGSTAGTGFLVSKQLAVTCAHVVDVVSDTIQVQFTGQTSILSAKIITKYYRDSNNGDIAFLCLEYDPENIIPLRLGVAEHSLSGNLFQTFGYPEVGEIEGVHARGEILGLVAENGQRLIQLRSLELNQGHSGAPVWDEKRNVVVGMVISVYKSDVSGKLRDTAFAIPSETLWNVCPEIQPSEICPYRGLETFTEETARFFFGREALTEKLLNGLRGGSRFLAVLGSSGSGKSSVVRAGLLPALKNGLLPGSQKWAQILMSPNDDPFNQTKTVGFNLNDISGYFKTHPGSERIILFIDQFEELFTLCPSNLCERFVHDLATGLEDRNLILILSMRDEFYSVFNAKATLLAESQHLKIENVTGPLKNDELLAMIERPAKIAGLELEEGLTELIVKDLTHRGEVHNSILPLLEFALTQLWERRRDGQLTHDAYKDIGGVTGSLARWADDAFSELPQADQMLAESLLTSLIYLGDEVQGLPNTRRRYTLNELSSPEVNLHIIEHFTSRHLIIVSDNMIELVHDALLSEWSRLQGWIKNNRRNLLLRQSISDAARQWEASGRDKGLLNHRGPRLILALEISSLPKYYLGVSEQNYLDACKKFEKRQKGLKRLVMVPLLAMPFLLIATMILTPYISRYRNGGQAIAGKWILIQPDKPSIIGMNEAEVKRFEDICPKVMEDGYDCVRIKNWLIAIGSDNIQLPAFRIMDNEVTNAQYQQCVVADQCEPPEGWHYAEDQVNYPATRLNWNQAQNYCQWIEGSLPTQNQWETAARGPAGYTFPWGNFWDPSKANLNHLENGSVNIDKYAESDNSGYDIKNLAGNVQEWTADVVPDAPEVMVFTRGGSWSDDPLNGMVVMRGQSLPTDRVSTIGFRCVRNEVENEDIPWKWWWIWLGKY